jgi:hypothetical protein
MSKHIIYSELKGGLGNMLFQIAAAVSLGIEQNKEVIFIDSTHQGTIHKSVNFYFDNIFRKLKFSNVIYENIFYSEQNFSYQKIPNVNNNIRLNGYFQSEKYFLPVKQQILDLFSMDVESKKFISDKYFEFNFDDFCSIHVRRGDYLKYPNIHPVCELNYYTQCVSNINSKNLFIFSDDIDWCMSNFDFKDKNVFFSSENRDYIDLWIMSLCRENIIANSTFSWWGAWLNKHEHKKVFYPKRWFGSSINHDTKDLCPNDWISV